MSINSTCQPLYKHHQSLFIEHASDQYQLHVHNCLTNVCNHVFIKKIQFACELFQAALSGWFLQHHRIYGTVIQDWSVGIPLSGPQRQYFLQMSSNIISVWNLIYSEIWLVWLTDWIYTKSARAGSGQAVVMANLMRTREMQAITAGNWCHSPQLGHCVWKSNHAQSTIQFWSDSPSMKTSAISRNWPGHRSAPDLAMSLASENDQFNSIGARVPRWSSVKIGVLREVIKGLGEGVKHKELKSFAWCPWSY